MDDFLKFLSSEIAGEKSRRGYGRGMWKGRPGEMEGYLEGGAPGFFFSLTETGVPAVTGGRLDSKIQEKM